MNTTNANVSGEKGAGYVVELAEGGPWLAQDLSVAINWDERGVWEQITDAELALANSLKA